MHAMVACVAVAGNMTPAALVWQELVGMLKHGALDANIFPEKAIVITNMLLLHMSLWLCTIRPKAFV